MISHLWAAKGFSTLQVHLDLFSLSFATTIIKETLHNNQIWKTQESYLGFWQRFMTEN